ncbi:MAG: hypothetical protein KatS3mg111_3526 [Pirellulaceae bacterium]|nr:MAG: hypothetical protein KatS3mg111_3526 [Pirellulaceae bacterium]
MVSRHRYPMPTRRRTCRLSLARLLNVGLRNLKLGALGVALASGTIINGCTRQQYRCKTDTEAYYLLDEKVAQSLEPNTALYRIEVDPRSRMFDPFNPDRPPMPEDDPQANLFMQRVDGKKGYPLWEANGRTNTLENPHWWEYLPLDERGVLVLDLNEAVRIGLIHSPTYQSNLEELYLSALDVSTERFLLDSQFFGGWQGTWTTDGPRRGNPSTPNSSTTFTTGPFSRSARPLVMRKQFATGADLIVGLANSITWQLAGPNDQSATSLIDFSLIQPLLRQGGRDVVLERLTLAERTLLANVRAFERFRRAYYIQIATGRNPDTSPRRRGGVFGGAGLGGFDVLGSVFSGGGGGGGGFGGGGNPGSGGFLGLLQQQINIANQEENIVRLQDLYLQLEDTYRELLMTMPENQTEIPSQQIQVAQALQNIYSAQTSLLNQQSQYQSALDSFKAVLGLPPYLCIEVKDDLLDQFKLISQELRNRRTKIAADRAAIGQVNSAVLAMSRTEVDEATGNMIRVLPQSAELTAQLEMLVGRLRPLGSTIQNVLNEDVAQIREDIERLRSRIPERRRQLDRLQEVVRREQGNICGLLPLGDFNTSFLEGEGLEQLPEELLAELDKLVAKLEGHAEAFEQLNLELDRVTNQLEAYASDRERFVDVSETIILGSQDLVAALNESVLTAQLIQARARTESALLPEIDIEPHEAVEIARRNRRDWLNNRANLVNSWRSIEVVADDLESYLDFTITGDVQNVGDNPLAFRSTTGRLRVGLTWDAPITRLQERNNYRQVLIQYQRARRSLYQYEDNIWASMRSTLRTVRQNQLSFEIQRFAVQNAALQISVNEDIRSINETLGQVSGPTAARDAVQGLQAFLATQSDLIGIFVQFEAIRRSLDLDLGTMEVDAEGIWIDPGPIRVDTVGGGLGDAILDYGLTAEEKQLRRQVVAMGQQPVEFAPTETSPVTPLEEFRRRLASVRARWPWSSDEATPQTRPAPSVMAPEAPASHLPSQSVRRADSPGGTTPSPIIPAALSRPSGTHKRTNTAYALPDSTRDEGLIVGDLLEGQSGFTPASGRTTAPGGPHDVKSDSESVTGPAHTLQRGSSSRAALHRRPAAPVEVEEPIPVSVAPYRHLPPSDVPDSYPRRSLSNLFAPLRNLGPFAAGSTRTDVE